MRKTNFDYHELRLPSPGRPHQGLDRLVDAAVGCWRSREQVLRVFHAEAIQIAERTKQLRQYPDSRLRQSLADCRDSMRRQSKKTPAPMLESLALLVEAAERTLGLRPYPVQILGALALHLGYLIEMATGEGKSLTACLPAILAAWTGRPCHLLTSNDYLASRDAIVHAPLYRFCGTDSAWVGSQMESAERRRNYQAGVVYTTGKELLADFLRDRLLLGDITQPPRLRLQNQLRDSAQAITQPVLRGIDTAFVDEADSVLIDEAVTPLIISQPQRNEALIGAIQGATDLAGSLTAELDYRIDHRRRELALTARGKALIAASGCEHAPLLQGTRRREEMVLTSLAAREFFRRDAHYIIDQAQVAIVDEFTGRVMPQRTWRQGLHQALEALEGLPLSDPSETLARLSFQRFFRLFRKLGGMSGTIQESAAELWHVYRLPTLCLPTHRPCRRQLLPPRFYPDQASKWQAICAEISSRHASGQPVLIGTRSVATSELLSAKLAGLGIPHRLLNALKHHEEATIIATAGEAGSVTIATNMAGRGSDIKLGAGVAELGGLHVIVSERHEAKRVDRQLYGRCARQGDPGSARAYSSLDDELLRRHGSKALLKLAAAGARRQPEQNRFAELLIAQAQRVAQNQACAQRKAVMQADDWLSNALAFAPASLE